MKKLIRIFLMGIALLGTGSVFSQDFLGKTKSQIMAEIAKSVPKDNIVVSQSNGYDYYWFGFAGSSIDNYTYFNSNGICFLEKYVTSNQRISQIETNRQSEDPKFHYYYAQFPWENNSHEFVQNKMSLELTITENKVLGGRDYHLWYFKPGDKQTVLHFFEKYYSKIIDNQYSLDKSVKDVKNESLNQFINDLKEVLTKRDSVKIRDFLGGRLLEMFDLNPEYHDWADEYYGHELHKKNSRVWDIILKAIEPGGAKEDSDRGFYIYPWYEAGFDKYLGIWNDRTERFDNRLVEDHEAGAIIGENINVRSAPSMNASVICKLSWEAIRVDRDFENDDWVKISTLDLRKQGYVSSKYIFQPHNLRVIIAKDIVMYRCDNENFTLSEIFKYLLTEKNISGSEIYKLLDSGQYTLPKEQQIDRGWKIIGFRTWD